jgi:hypothetical protein
MVLSRWVESLIRGCLPVAVRARPGVGATVDAVVGVVRVDARGVGGGATERVGVAERGGVVLVRWRTMVGVITGAGAIVLMLTFVMSRPARSMATHAVPDTPTTAASQIAAMPLAERRWITMLPLCQIPDGKPRQRGTSS